MRQKLNAQFWLCSLMLMLSVSATANNNTKPFAAIEDYIEAHKDIAVSEMHRAQIPASIKLAQGIIESNYGNSYLARNGNNHFGIKCHSTWDGPRLFRDDDKANECFRGYNNTYESYVDHSDFVSRNRYAHLFDLPITDYKNWAKGLQKAGYATDQTYAKQIIFVVEKYNLHNFDLQSGPVYAGQTSKPKVKPLPNNTTAKKNRETKTYKDTPSKNEQFRAERKAQKEKEATKKNSGFGKMEKKGRTYPTSLKRDKKKGDVFIYNRLKTVVTTKEARPRDIARMYGLTTDRLCKYNDFLSDQVIPSNTKVYLQQKRNKGPWNKRTHKVKVGETIKDIAQEYGIKETKLFTRNFMAPGQQPAPGQLVYLRGKTVRRPALVSDYYAEENYKTKKQNSAPKEKVKVPSKATTTPPARDKETYIPRDIVSGSTSDKVETPKTTTTKVYDYNTGSAKVETPKTTTTKVYDYNTGNVQVETPETTTTTRKVYDYNAGNTTIETPETTTIREYATESSEKNNTSKKIINNRSSETYKYTESVTKEKANSQPVTSQKHIVVKGDTLYSLSRRFGLTVEELKKANGLVDNTISINQELTIPSK